MRRCCGLIETFTPGSIDIPFVGPVGGLDTLLSWGSILLMAVLSVFLMIPVASAFSGLFLEDVAQAVEDQHYPALPPVARQRFGDALIDTANFIGLLLALNTGALLLYPFAGPFSPLLFWGMNGYLLGREYFTLGRDTPFGARRCTRDAQSLSFADLGGGSADGSTFVYPTDQSCDSGVGRRHLHPYVPSLEPSVAVGPQPEYIQIGDAPAA